MTPRKKPPASPTRSRVVFELVDDEHVRVRVEWPPGGDVTALGIILGLINAGKMVDQQRMSIGGFAAEVGDPEAASFLSEALRRAETLIGLGGPAPDNRPLIRPTEVVERQMKMRGDGG